MAQTRFISTMTKRIVDCILIIAVVLTAWRAWSFMGPSRTFVNPPSKAIEIGSELTLTGLDWSTAPRHLVLAIRSTCPACTQSASFYRAVSEAIRPSGTVLTVVSPEPPQIIRKWLEQHGIEPQQVIADTSLVDLGFAVTPTALIVDRTGRVTDKLSGKLAEDDEIRLRARLEGLSVVPLDDPKRARLLDERTVQSFLESPETVVVDVRDREAFRRDHRPGAINIPHDEIEIRASLELPFDRFIVIDCSGAKLRRCQIAGDMLLRLGARRVSIAPPRPAG